MRKKSIFDHIKVMVTHIITVTLWQLGYWIFVDKFSFIKSYIFPSPIGILISFTRLIKNNILFVALINSFYKLFIGLTISVLLGIILGLVLTYSKFSRKLLKPLILGLQTLPNVCIVPFALLWFGLNDKATIFVVVIGSMFSISISTEIAIKSVNPIFIKTAQTMGANNLDVFFKIILPASIPELISGLRQGWAFAWRALIAGEMVSGTIGGLGHILLVSRELLDINQIMAVVFVLVIISAIIENFVFSKIENMARKKVGLIP